jgi:hypothetical protein
MSELEPGDWELISQDLFDRESAPRRDAHGGDAQHGLELLWRKVLDEGVQDDGRPTLTAFGLRLPGRRVDLPRDPLSNPGLAKLRGWRSLPGLIEALASSTRSSPAEAPSVVVALAKNAPGEEPLLEQLRMLRNVLALRTAIATAFAVSIDPSKPTWLRPNSVVYGEGTPALRAVAAGPVGATGTSVYEISPIGLTVEARALRFAIEMVRKEPAGWTWQTVFDAADPRAAKLADALEAGWPTAQR